MCGTRVPCSEYVATKTQRWKEREAFQMPNRCGHGLEALRYPIELLEMPLLADWFCERVRDLQNAGNDVDVDVQ